MQKTIALTILLAATLLVRPQPPQDLLELLSENENQDPAGQDQSWIFQVIPEKHANLNLMSAEDLLEILILTEEQALAFLSYRKRYNIVLEWEELARIPGFDTYTISRLRRYYTLATPVITDIRRQSQNLHGEVSQRISCSELSNLRKKQHQWAGSPVRAHTRIRSQAGKAISAGLTAEKDEGEKVVGNQGPDFLSAHLFYSREAGLLRKLGVGDYQLSSGQGLVTGSGLSGAQSVKARNLPVKPYTSVNESRFFRGITAQLSRGSLTAVLAFSLKNIDASSNSSRLGFPQSGLHRTPSELKSRKNMRENLSALLLGYKVKNTEFTLTHLWFERKFRDKQSPAAEQAFWSIAWQSQLNRGIFFGEALLSRPFPAFVTGYVQRITRRTDITILVRNYPGSLSNPFSMAYSASGRNYNEQGVFLGLSHEITPRWRLSCSFDQYRYREGSHHTAFPTRQYEGLVQLGHEVRRKYSLYLRFRFQLTQKDKSDGDQLPTLQNQEREWLRLHGELQVTPAFQLRMRVEYAQRRFAEMTEGILVYQDAAIKINDRLSVNLRLAGFRCDDYDDRLYAFENDFLYSYSVPAYSGWGRRFYVLIKTHPARNLDVLLRYGAWIRRSDVPGQGAENEAGLQVRYRF